MVNEDCRYQSVSGIQRLETPPPRLVLQVGCGLQERLWVITSLQPCTDNPQKMMVLGRVHQDELYALVFSLLKLGIQFSLKQAKSFLGIQLHRILTCLRNQKMEP